ncbi:MULTISPECIES: D-sedoheptulose-7-phosphate isomerase [Prochlorococcus]|uniref:Phosphoheptose isomerase 1 n=1 Tax=Prochlorococcus marinus str. MIT 9116 TaxID=167544 RepID=A0A0A1ZWZ3_PROMR|nr:SIS domain-containing protein [Prochlorococcus marinus]KGF91979.1 Phosphoheptose isomerase 1 [Prochlorococcus marinus str. MIT 9107]KGF93066.1 Phosphoheptose isomerase 1 [Prochlorococcus marinus str. MIT 9116]KGF93976.1 Phosphoheptose isomerase 1 [Prochlorococcus marinus str. MIT 9123]
MKKSENFNYLERLKNTIGIISSSNDFYEIIDELSEDIISSNSDNKIVVIYGNGGSAADAQHFSAELIGTYLRKDRKPYKSIALTTDTSFTTAWSNDFEFSSIFSRQIEALYPAVGLSIGLSTSGKSENVLNALKLSNSLDIKTVLISGERCPEHDFVKKIFRIPSVETSIIQTVTQIMYHSICNTLEKV